MKRILKKNLKYILSFLFLVVLMIITFTVIFNKFSIKEVFKAIGNTNFKLLSLACLMPILYILFEALSMKSIAKKIGANSSLLKHTEYAGVDFYFSAITPSATGGQPMMYYYMHKDKISIAQSSVILMLSTAMSKMVLIVLGIFCLIYGIDIFKEADGLFKGCFIFGICFNAFIVTFLLLAVFKGKLLKKVCTLFINFFYKIKICKDKEKWESDVENKINEYHECSKFVKEHKMVFLESILYNLVHRVSVYSVVYIVYRAFGLNEASYLDMLTIQVYVSIGVDSLPLPGGMGASELFLSGLLSSYFIGDTYVAAMLITRFISYYFLLIIAFVIVVVKQIKVTINDKKKAVVDVLIEES